MPESDVLKLSNVVGFGDGLKRVKRKNTGKKALLVFVEKKTNNIPSDQRIPDNIDGKITDVIEVGKLSHRLLTPCSANVMQQTVSPIRGGLQISTSDFVGTLGVVVKDATSGNLVGLTNAHVAHNPLTANSGDKGILDANGYGYLDSATAKDLPIWQSNPSDGNLMGTVVRDMPRSPSYKAPLDAAIISISAKYGVTAGIVGLTKYPPVFVHPDNVPLGSTVYKSGRTTGITKGELISKNSTFAIELAGGVSVTYSDQLYIYSDDLDVEFAGGGDSGSAICIDRGDGTVGVIGLLSTGTDIVDGDGSYCGASRIDKIVNYLEILPWDGSVIVPNTNDDFISTGMGSLYATDSSTFIKTTNDFVCAHSNSANSPSILECIDGNIQVKSSINRLVSGALNTKNKLELNPTVIYTKAQCDTDVSVGITSIAYSGAYIDSDVAINMQVDSHSCVVLAASADIVLGITARTISESFSSIGVSAELDSYVVVRVACDTSANICSVATADAVVNVLAKLGTEVSNGTGSIASLDVVIGFRALAEVGTDTVGNLIYGDTPENISLCDQNNYAELSYGESL